MRVINRVRILIKLKEKTLSDVAHDTGLSFQQLSAIQNNKPSKISYTTIGTLVSYFGCTFNDLFEIVE